MSRLTEANYAADRALRKTLRNAGPALIDEAHNFRNNNRRRRTLLDFLKGAAAGALSATTPTAN